MSDKRLNKKTPLKIAGKANIDVMRNACPISYGCFLDDLTRFIEETRIRMKRCNLLLRTGSGCPLYAGGVHSMKQGDRLQYYCEGENEKTLLNVLKTDFQLILPGKVNRFNAVDSILTEARLRLLLPVTIVVLVFDTDTSSRRILDVENEPRKYYQKAALYIRFRLRLLDLLPENVGKILFLDVDIVVQGELTEPFETNLEGYYLAAAPNDITKGSVPMEFRKWYPADRCYGFC